MLLEALEDGGHAVHLGVCRLGHVGDFGFVTQYASDFRDGQIAEHGRYYVDEGLVSFVVVEPDFLQ